MSPEKARRWRRFFSAALILLFAVLALTVAAAIQHYKTYPGRVERDSISSPGRGADYIIVSWDETHNTEVYKVWWKEDTAEEETVDTGTEEAGNFKF